MSPTETLLSSLEDEETVKNRYQVELPDFYGPMDLLLTLIEQEDMEITKISLAKVTDQFLAYINATPNITPDMLTQFLIVAAKLILIKSQVLLPKPPPGLITEAEETGADDLVQQLKDYKRFKQLAQELEAIQSANRRSFVRTAPLPKIEPRLNMGDVVVGDLLKAVRQALAVKPEQPQVNSVVSRETITIGTQISLIKNRLTTHKKVGFYEFLTRLHSRVEVIVTLLAVLELVKRHAIDIEQTEDFGEINIIKKENAALSEDEWLKLSEINDIS